MDEGIKRLLQSNLANQAKRELTLEEIRKGLGLEPFEVISYRAKECGTYPRRSGRTTRMLLQAIEASQRGKVFISAHTADYARELANLARLYCIQLGLDEKRVSFDPGRRFSGRGLEVLGEDQVFSDHYRGRKLGESMEENELRNKARER